MKRLLPILCLALVALWGSFVAWRDRPQRQMDAATQAVLAESESEPDMLLIIHEPKDGCPQDWRFIPKAFYEPDGTYESACSHGTGAQGAAMDYLRPNEDFPGVAAIWTLSGKPI